MYVLDIFAIAWLFLGTRAIKAMLKAVAVGRLPRLVLIVASTLLAVLPMLALKLQMFAYSAISVVVAGVVLFWFCILMGRMGRAT